MGGSYVVGTCLIVECDMQLLTASGAARHIEFVEFYVLSNFKDIEL